MSFEYQTNVRERWLHALLAKQANTKYLGGRFYSDEVVSGMVEKTSVVKTWLLPACKQRWGGIWQIWRQNRGYATIGNLLLKMLRNYFCGGVKPGSILMRLFSANENNRDSWCFKSACCQEHYDRSYTIICGRVRNLGENLQILVLFLKPNKIQKAKYFLKIAQGNRVQNINLLKLFLRLGVKSESFWRWCFEMDILEAAKRLSIHPSDEETPQGFNRSFKFREKRLF